MSSIWYKDKKKVAITTLITITVISVTFFVVHKTSPGSVVNVNSNNNEKPVEETVESEIVAEVVLVASDVLEASVETDVTEKKEFVEEVFIKDEFPTKVEVKTKVAPKESVAKESFDNLKMLSLHNTVRVNAGVPPLVWSDSIAKSAQSWSDQIEKENCKPRHDLDGPYGENIYWQWMSKKSVTGLVSKPSDATTFWSSEDALYDYSKNTCESGEQCGHYTQMVWRDTTQVGCGVSSCLEDGVQTDVWVCRYNPPGNDGDRPY